MWSIVPGADADIPVPDTSETRIRKNRPFKPHRDTQHFDIFTKFLQSSGSQLPPKRCFEALLMALVFDFTFVRNPFSSVGPGSDKKIKIKLGATTKTQDKKKIWRNKYNSCANLLRVLEPSLLFDPALFLWPEFVLFVDRFSSLFPQTAGWTVSYSPSALSLVCVILPFFLPEGFRFAFGVGSSHFLRLPRTVFPFFLSWARGF